ncbi:hypothetical protein [Streptosporangium canum]|uniref:hypothetical protein n=1 Tax=Streptosporangium canum TaxID=324952 RepID=UPI0033ACFCCD
MIHETSAEDHTHAENGASLTQSQRRVAAGAEKVPACPITRDVDITRVHVRRFERHVEPLEAGQIQLIVSLGERHFDPIEHPALWERQERVQRIGSLPSADHGPVGEQVDLVNG